MTYSRPSGRTYDQLRPVTIEAPYSPYAEGSCLIRMGRTHVICTASIEDKTPPFLRNTGKGWVTAEYGLLPRATHSRMDREAVRGKQTGRTQEIQRLIGRAMRAVTKLEDLEERQIKLDCDVIQADGGTRTAAITGAWVALHLACERLLTKGILKTQPLTDQLAAVSCGLISDAVLLDLDYAEDSGADTDANFVMSGASHLVEVQATAENKVFSQDQFTEMLTLARTGCQQLFDLQLEAVHKALNHNNNYGGGAHG